MQPLSNNNSGSIKGALYSDHAEALEEVIRLRSQPENQGMMVSCEPTGYGDYQIVIIPFEVVMGGLIINQNMNIAGGLNPKTSSDLYTK